MPISRQPIGIRESLKCNTLGYLEKRVAVMFWKRFGQTQRAGRLFNQASENWEQRQYFLLEGDKERATEASIEVIRLCQLSIQKDGRTADAYVLLATALLSSASQFSRRKNPDQYEFLLSRAAAVIHLWYSLPYKGNLISESTAAVGERLWRITVDQIMQDKKLSETDMVTLMYTYRNKLAANTISPASFPEIQKVIMG
jgi:hypothetical protein